MRCQSWRTRRRSLAGGAWREKRKTEEEEQTDLGLNPCQPQSMTPVPDGQSDAQSATGNAASALGDFWLRATI